MPSLMKPHVAPDPLQVDLLGAVRQVPRAPLLPRHLEQSRSIRHAPYPSGGLGDIARTVRESNQGLARSASRLSNAFVQFLRPIWVAYL